MFTMLLNKAYFPLRVQQQGIRLALHHYFPRLYPPYGKTKVSGLCQLIFANLTKILESLTDLVCSECKAMLSCELEVTCRTSHSLPTCLM